MKLIKLNNNGIDDINQLDYMNHLLKTAGNSIRVNKYIATYFKSNIGYCDLYQENAYTYVYVIYVRKYQSQKCIDLYSELFYYFNNKLCKNKQIKKMEIIYIYPTDIKQNDIVRLSQRNARQSVSVSEIFLSKVVAKYYKQMNNIIESINNRRDIYSYYIVAATLLPLIISDKNHRQEVINELFNRARSLYDVKMKHLITKELELNLLRFDK